MKPSIRVVLGLAGVLAGAAGACGGTVAVDPGTGGAGGATTTSTTATFTSASSTSSGSTSSTSTGSTSSTSTSSASTSSSTSTSTSASSSSGGDPCSTGTDCTTCTSAPTCQQCLMTVYPDGYQLYEALLTCLYCTACYTVCEGATEGCSGPPATVSSCDVGTPSMPGTGACGSGPSDTGCIACAENSGGPCQGEVVTCALDADCMAYAGGLLDDCMQGGG